MPKVNQKINFSFPVKKKGGGNWKSRQGEDKRGQPRQEQQQSSRTRFEYPLRGWPTLRTSRRRQLLKYLHSNIY